jgi:hypothetical protein
MNIYAAWFKNQLTSWPKRIFSLSGSHDIFENSLFLSEKAKNPDEYFKIVRLENPSGFGKRAVSALIAALKDSRYSNSLKTELVPLFFPDKKEVTEHELEAAIKEAANA